VHHARHAGADRLKPRLSQQVQRLCSETSHDPSAIALVTMGVLMELGVADPVLPAEAAAERGCELPGWE
jgi:hypothetical protein